MPIKLYLGSLNIINDVKKSDKLDIVYADKRHLM